ncbi:MAG: dienelactone hydrolase family protein [Candidatus Hydrogenedentes bacterium]|nr:dienelactone hydrolase family protein [Candidatus Hydrogenedentota bacterium]
MQLGIAADAHSARPIQSMGPTPEHSDATLVLVHGRGATAENILSLYEEFGLPTLAALAPQAADFTWYPQSFLAPLELNQPFLDSALNRLESIVAGLIARAIPGSRIALLGFSQGACLTLEFAARHPRHYGAIIGLTGGLIGPPGTPRDYAGSLKRTPVFLGTSDIDPHVPLSRVQETETILARMGAEVELRVYPGMEHTINEDEMDACRAILQTLVSQEREARP